MFRCINFWRCNNFWLDGNQLNTKGNLKIATGWVQNFLVGIVPLPKSPLSKTKGHKALNFQSCRLENELLQELKDEMFIIISNNIQSKINPFIKFIWEDHQLEFVTTIVQKFTTVYHLHWYETGIDFLIAVSCHRLSHKN